MKKVMQNNIKAILITLILGVLFAYGSEGKYSTYAMLLEDHVCEKGVDYSAYKDDPLREKARKEMTVSKEQYQGLSEKEKIAYLINLYNFYTLELIAENYPTESIRDLKKPWDRDFVPFKGKEVSLNHIEHEVLREDFDEPRLHFALNCASIGCPKLRNEPYVSAKLDEQLNDAAAIFLGDPKRNRLKGKKFYASKIFDWYGQDFESKYGGWKNYIEEVLDKKDLKFKYLEYDWSLNEAKSCS